MTETIQIWFRRFDPIDVEVVERRGVWAVRPTYTAWPEDDAPTLADGFYTVTHVPSGSTLYVSLRLSLGEAIRLMNMVADAFPSFEHDVAFRALISMDTPECRPVLQAWHDWFMAQ